MFDAAIVGAGPAGATAARLLARRGLKVLLIERAKMPRPKLCAGAVSLRAERYLPEDWDNAVVATVYGGNLGWRGETYLKVRDGEPVVKIVDRKSFDTLLALKARDAGAVLRENERFLNFHRENDHFKVVTDREVYAARVLIGADGALSRVAASAGVERRVVPVLETTVELDLPEDEVFIDLGVVGWGYGWIFPRGGGRFSVGIASLKREKRPIREIFEEYLNSHPLLRGAKRSPIRGWFIPVNRGSLAAGEERLLLAGDASGAADALLGEGIYYSVRQAHLLAECVLSEDPAACYARLLKPLEREFFFGFLSAFIAYSFQKRVFSFASEEDLKLFFEFLRGRADFKRIFFYGLGRLFKSFLPFSRSAR